MELVVRKNELLRELQLFQGIVERKNTIPILANVLIEAKGDEVRMLATDLEVALRSRCQAAVAKSGSLTLPAKKLYEIVKALPETDVRIEQDRNGVKVAADRFDSRMQTLPREDFPTLPDVSGTARATLPGWVVNVAQLSTPASTPVSAVTRKRAAAVGSVLGTAEISW